MQLRRAKMKLKRIWCLLDATWDLHVGDVLVVSAAAVVFAGVSLSFSKIA